MQQHRDQGLPQAGPDPVQRRRRSGRHLGPGPGSTTRRHDRRDAPVGRPGHRASSAQFRELGIEPQPLPRPAHRPSASTARMAHPASRSCPGPSPPSADQVVLAAGACLEEIEEHSVDVVPGPARRCEAQRAPPEARASLHGPPGTGKTHTIRYLISQMPDATVLRHVGASWPDPESSSAAQPHPRGHRRHRSPASMVFDDVDFIAEDRSLPGMTDTRDVAVHPPRTARRHQRRRRPRCSC